MGIQMAWNDASRALTLELAPGSCLLTRTDIEIRMGQEIQPLKFDGSPIKVSF
jgi:hypothetical protein